MSAFNSKIALYNKLSHTFLKPEQIYKPAKVISKNIVQQIEKQKKK